MKKTVYYIIVVCLLFFSSCQNSVNQQEENEIKSLQQTNIELKDLILFYNEVYLKTFNSYGIDESYFHKSNKIISFVKRLEKDESLDNESFKKLIETIDCCHDLCYRNKIDINITKSKKGRAILVNKVLTANLSYLMSCLKNQKESNFQVNTIKLSPVNYDMQYKKKT